MVLLRHRFSLSVVLVALLATAGVFTFARPEPPGYGESHQLKVPKSPPPAHGWTWADGTPGWSPPDMSHDLREFYGNIWTSDLIDAGAAATKAGIALDSLRVLRSMRAGQHDGFLAIVAGANRSGRTCLGFVLPSHPVRFTCPRSQIAFLEVDAAPFSKGRPTWPTLKAAHMFPLFLEGVVRADVTRVVVSGSVSQPVYERSSYFWGTFIETPGDSYLAGSVPARDPWCARVDFYGARGLLATLRIRLNRSGYQLLTVG